MNTPSIALYIVAALLLIYVLQDSIRNRKLNVSDAVALLGVVVSIIIATSFGGFPLPTPVFVGTATPQTAATELPSTYTPTQLPTLAQPISTVEGISTSTLVFCGNLGENATYTTKPNQYVIGDIVVDNVSYTDASYYTEEGTVAFFEHEASVYAKYGAGCWNGDRSYLQELVANEFEYGCGDLGCKTIRQVIFQADGSISVMCYSSLSQVVECPPVSFP